MEEQEARELEQRYQKLELKQQGLIEELLEQFDNYLRNQGYQAKEDR